MDTAKGLLLQATNFMTAAIGFIDLNEPQRATEQLKLAIDVVEQVKERLTSVLATLETGAPPV